MHSNLSRVPDREAVLRAIAKVVDRRANRFDLARALAVELPEFPAAAEVTDRVRKEMHARFPGAREPGLLPR